MSLELRVAAELAPLHRLIAARTGLLLSRRESERVLVLVQTRCKALGLATIAEYVHWLTTAAAHREWDTVLTAAVNPETYFFRDRGQMSLLGDRLLLDLMAQRRQIAEQTGRPPSLRLWSAGCSTGEEAYSLAILTLEALANRGEDPAQWHIEILGTDLSLPALARAEQATYGSWSFRACEDWRRSRYFTRVLGGEQVNRPVRSLVRFAQLNLASPQFDLGGWETGGVDLILCRNVFIYFDPRAIAPVLDRFAQALRPKGWLMTGHAELLECSLDAWDLRLFPESSAYQRRTPLAIAPPHRDQGAADSGEIAPSALRQRHDPLSPGWAGGAAYTAVAPPGRDQLAHRPRLGDSLPGQLPAGQRQSPRLQHPSLPPFSPPPDGSTPDSGPTDGSLSEIAAQGLRQHPRLREGLAEIERLVTAGQREAAIALAQTWLDQHPRQVEILHRLAQLQADAGRHAIALELGLAAVELDPNQPALCCTLAHIYAEQGQVARAKQFYKRAIYLDHQAIEAFFSLGDLYKSEGDDARGDRAYRAARDLLLAQQQRGQVDFVWQGRRLPTQQVLKELDRVLALG